ncbi:MAG: phosphomannomutase, partial [Candidatus Aminicenantes bacterium]|nr:phosphomannomutase [Candidatus Aminicenantes bacterium]
MDINPKIFREYDIRGIVGQDLDDEAVEILGRAMGTFFLAHGQKRAAVGQDCRM